MYLNLLVDCVLYSRSEEDYICTYSSSALFPAQFGPLRGNRQRILILRWLYGTQSSYVVLDRRRRANTRSTMRDMAAPQCEGTHGILVLPYAIGGSRDGPCFG